MRILLIFLLLFTSTHSIFAEDGENVVVMQHDKQDSTVIGQLFNKTIFMHQSKDSLTRVRHKKTFFHRVGNVFTKFFKEFNHTDSVYIEPQHYNYTVMMQNTNTYELYTLSTESGQKITFAPDISYRLGPYLGWRWVFLGYTLDLKHINLNSSHTGKKEFDLSLYSSLLGVDLFWRQTGNDYHIQKMTFADNIDGSPMKGVDFDGIKSSIRGFNLYYIFNHRKFSYPAAYSQSTMQKKSAGSMLLGIGYTRHTLEVDWTKLDNIVQERMKETASEVRVDSSMMFDKVKYTDVSVSCGYAYNWVFARHWLFNASLSMAVAYNQSKSDIDPSKNVFHFKNFSFNNMNVDGIGRFAVVWNNNHWYTGMSAIVHTYNYKKGQFSTNNSFGSINFYLGVNFGKKRAYKNKK